MIKATKDQQLHKRVDNVKGNFTAGSKFVAELPTVYTLDNVDLQLTDIPVADLLFPTIRINNSQTIQLPDGVALDKIQQYWNARAFTDSARLRFHLAHRGVLSLEESQDGAIGAGRITDDNGVQFPPVVSMQVEGRLGAGVGVNPNVDVLYSARQAGVSGMQKFMSYQEFKSVNGRTRLDGFNLGSQTSGYIRHIYIIGTGITEVEMDLGQPQIESYRRTRDEMQEDVLNAVLPRNNGAALPADLFVIDSMLTGSSQGGWLVSKDENFHLYVTTSGASDVQVIVETGGQLGG